MYANSLNQFISFSIFIIIGLIIGIVFDIFRILRKSFKTSDLITYVEDILFWIITGIIILYSIFKFNDGELRLYIFIGLFIGILLHIKIISNYFILINVKIIKLLKIIIYKSFNILIFPIKIIFKAFRRMLIKPICFAFINIRVFSTKKINKIKNNLKNIKIDKKAQKKEGI